MSSELYIQKNQSGEYHIFDDDNHQYWGPFFNLSDAQEMLAQIEGNASTGSTMTKAEWRDLYDACFLVMTTITEKLDGTSGEFFTPKEKEGLRAEYDRFAILSGKVHDLRGRAHEAQ